jgi:hypothetical protein
LDEKVPNGEMADEESGISGDSTAKWQCSIDALFDDLFDAPSFRPNDQIILNSQLWQRPSRPSQISTNIHKYQRLTFKLFDFL